MRRCRPLAKFDLVIVSLLASICTLFGYCTKISSLFVVRLRSLLHLHSVINYQVHEFIEALEQRVALAAVLRVSIVCAYPYFSLDTYSKLFVKPYRDG